MDRRAPKDLDTGVMQLHSHNSAAYELLVNILFHILYHFNDGNCVLTRFSRPAEPNYLTTRQPSITKTHCYFNWHDDVFIWRAFCFIESRQHPLSLSLSLFLSLPWGKWWGMGVSGTLMTESALCMGRRASMGE